LWGAAKAESKVVKLGGGFYIAPVTVGDKQLYLINGFYESMRKPFLQPDSRVYYFSLSWPQSALSFARFRAEVRNRVSSVVVAISRPTLPQVLGATDPSQAAEGSLRREIFAKWQELGLSGSSATQRAGGWNV
jgi:hypothetical protein